MLKTLPALALLTCLSLPAAAQEPRVPMNRWLFEFDGRLASGLGYTLSPLTGYNVAVEASATFRVGLEPWYDSEWTLTLMPEIGYTGFVNGVSRSDYFVTGVGLGYTWSDWFTVGMVPGFLVGAHNDLYDKWGNSWGFRISVVAELITIIGVQAAYQTVSFDGRYVPECQFTFSLNLMPIVVLAYIGGH